MRCRRQFFPRKVIIKSNRSWSLEKIVVIKKEHKRFRVKIGCCERKFKKKKLNISGAFETTRSFSSRCLSIFFSDSRMASKWLVWIKIAFLATVFIDKGIDLLYAGVRSLILSGSRKYEDCILCGGHLPIRGWHTTQPWKIHGHRVTVERCHGRHHEQCYGFPYIVVVSFDRQRHHATSIRIRIIERD